VRHMKFRVLNVLLLIIVVYIFSFGPALFLLSTVCTILPDFFGNTLELFILPHLLFAYHVKPYWQYGEMWISLFGFRETPRASNHENFRQYIQEKFKYDMKY